MKKNVVGGVLLAVLAALALWIGSALKLPFEAIVFTAGVGLVLGIVKVGSPIARVFSFLIGFVLAWVFFALQAAFLPQVLLSQIVSAVVVILLVTLLAVLTKSKMPLWASILGAATMVGAYQTAFGIAPQNFLSESIPAAGSALFGVALGLVVAGLVELIAPDADDSPAGIPAAGASAAPASPPASPPAANQDTDSVGVNILKG
ncbi:MAG: hypothetical protein WCP28_20890 [Actinomycetes bacterium]